MNKFVGGFCLLCFTLVKLCVGRKNYLILASKSCCENLLLKRIILDSFFLVFQMYLWWMVKLFNYCYFIKVETQMNVLDIIGDLLIFHCRMAYKLFNCSRENSPATPSTFKSSKPALVDVHAWPISKNDSLKLFTFIIRLVGSRRWWRKKINRLKTVLRFFHASTLFFHDINQTTVVGAIASLSKLAMTGLVFLVYLIFSAAWIDFHFRYFNSIYNQETKAVFSAESASTIRDEDSGEKLRHLAWKFQFNQLLFTIIKSSTLSTSPWHSSRMTITQNVCRTREF